MRIRQRHDAGRVRTCLKQMNCSSLQSRCSSARFSRSSSNVCRCNQVFLPYPLIDTLCHLDNDAVAVSTVNEAAAGLCLTLWCFPPRCAVCRQEDRAHKQHDLHRECRAHISQHEARPKLECCQQRGFRTSRSTSAYSGCSGGGGCSRLNSRSLSCCRSAYTLQQMTAADPSTGFCLILQF
jgi:hypothetical protein